MNIVYCMYWVLYLSRAGAFIDIMYCMLHVSRVLNIAFIDMNIVYAFVWGSSRGRGVPMSSVNRPNTSELNSITIYIYIYIYRYIYRERERDIAHKKRSARGGGGGV